MMNNPVTFYATGGSGDDRRSFIYEGGKELWHFSSYDNHLHEKYVEINIMFLANDEIHGLDILKRMFEFIKDCAQTRLSLEPQHLLGYRDRELIEKSNFYLELLKENKIVITKAPTDQIYNVSWASNDNIL
jgi:hypothetical protein